MSRWPADLPAARADLWQRLDEPHVAPLVEFADEIAEERGMGRGAVPYPDPDGGGVNARVLFLLNDPGDGAKNTGGGSGMLTILNTDMTSIKQRTAIDHTGFDRSAALHWNGIPWPVAKADRSRQITPAATALLRLLGKLDDLNGVITFGEFALKVWTAANRRTERYHGLEHVHSAHPERSSYVNLDAAYARAGDIATRG